MPVFTPISHDAFVDQVHVLAAELAKSAWTPSFIIGIGRGGLAPAVYLSHATGLPMLSVDHSSRVEDFSDAPLIKLAARTRDGERLLFVDDINDSGATINSDDPAYFGGYIGENYRQAAAARGLGKDQLVTLARNSFLGSFLSDDDVARHTTALDAYVAEHS